MMNAIQVRPPTPLLLSFSNWINKEGTSNSPLIASFISLDVVILKRKEMSYYYTAKSSWKDLISKKDEKIFQDGGGNLL